jgi:hypothetical protein
VPETVELLGTADDDVGRHTVSIQLIPNQLKWSKSEPGSASKIFKTVRGNYGVTAPNYVYLNDGRGTNVGELHPLVPGTAKKGDTGNGKAYETGRIFKWQVI